MFSKATQDFNSNSYSIHIIGLLQNLKIGYGENREVLVCLSEQMRKDQI